MKYTLSVICCATSLFISGCVSAPPRNINNVCHIFKQYPSWYSNSLAVQKRWGVPVAVQMAILHQESKFIASAQPPRTKLLWIIPWKRPSTAYGYAQILDGTWQHYKKTQGGLFSSRYRFADTVDFVGWYANLAHHKANIARNDAYSLYLAYHEGIGGYLRHSYLRKPWLMAVAKKVQYRAKLYTIQLKSCPRKRLWWLSLW